MIAKVRRRAISSERFAIFPGSETAGAADRPRSPAVYMLRVPGFANGPA
jgi:hypothetical protein